MVYLFQKISFRHFPGGTEVNHVNTVFLRQAMSGLQTGPLLPTTRPQPNVTGGWFPSGGVATTVTQCHYPDYNYDVATAVICGMYLVFGVVYSLFGK
jgi:hypothetical protein